MAGFNRGAKQIEQDEEARAAALSGKDNRLPYLKVEKGDTEIIRFLTDGDDEGWIKVAQHNYARCKPAPKGVSKWPKGLTGVCRYDMQIRDMLGTQDCYLCDHEVPSGSREEFAKPTPRVWALAVLRRQVFGDGSPEMGGPSKEGVVVGYDDEWEEYSILDDRGEPTGEKAERPKLVIVNMAWNNFFQPLSSMYQMYGTVLDRDFAIRRTGEGRDTTYSIVPLNPIPGLEPGSEQWKRYTDQLDARGITLEQTILDLASDVHYARFFDPTKEVDKDDNVVPAGTLAAEGNGASPSAAPASSPERDAPSEEDAARLAVLKDRLTGGRTS